MTEEVLAESVVDRLLVALAAQLAQSKEPVLAAGAAEALAGLSRAQAERIFGQAGLLVHYGADMEPVEALIRAITAVVRAEAPEDAPFKPGDQVRLVGALPEDLAEYDETWLRQTVHRHRNHVVKLRFLAQAALDYSPASLTTKVSRTATGACT